jgi:hypothetical protein
MDRDTLKLSLWLQDHGGLQNSRRVSARQKAGHLPDDYQSRDVSKVRCGTLPALSTDNLRRSKASTFESILIVPHRCFNETLLTLLRLHEAYVGLPSLFDLVPPQIAEFLEYNPYFSDRLGALDGTRIDAFVSGEPAAPYRPRKGRLS